MKSKLQRLKEKLDGIIQEKRLPFYPVCLVCGRPSEVFHHYIQKSQSLFLRWNKKNLIPLCSHCHCLHHVSGDPHIHEVIIRKKGFAWVDELEVDRRKIFKVNISILEEMIHDKMESKIL